MSLILLDRMWKQVAVAREESDTAMFQSLLFFAEMLLKLTTAGLISAIMDDRERHRYRHLHKLVRANRLGDWAGTIDDILTGPTGCHLMPAAKVEQKELATPFGQGAWQYEAARLLNICLKEVEPHTESAPQKLSAQRWFSLFVDLRNNTRGHGVPQPKVCSRISPALKESISLITANCCLFKRPWAYLHRNLSGKFRVTSLSDRTGPFDYLRATPSAVFENGVFVHFDQHAWVELISSDPDASDFFLPNGSFTGKQYELISYITGNKLSGDIAPYLTPTTALPPSETEGIGCLDVQGKSFGNLPPRLPSYVRRKTLEADLFKRLLDDRHPVVTLVGSGGTGKTSLALAVLHQIAEEERYEAILWFSSRDIDLLTEGPKPVKPKVMTEQEIAEEFSRLMEPPEAKLSGFKPSKYFSGALSKSPLDAPLLFVFDNFETVRAPGDLYVWLDTYIRSPNKVLITTRFRDFKGDFPVEVRGMSELESQQLIDETAAFLGIRRLLTPLYEQELIRESDGHPYIIKILLGEVAKSGRIQQIERIVGDRAQVLEALFDRTFAGLSPAAKQVFLTLCSWRSVVPQLAVEAVMMRPSNEKFDVRAAVDELVRSSLIESTPSPEEDAFLSVPLAAAVFGKRKLLVSALKGTIEANTEILHLLGAGQKTDIQHGIHPRIEKMFSHIAAIINKNKEQVGAYVQIMEFVARSHSPAWLLLARIFEESDLEDRTERAKEALRQYLQVTPRSKEQKSAWEKLARLCSSTKDWTGEMHARVEMCGLPDALFADISNTANRLNGLLVSEQFLAMDDKTALLQQLAKLMDSRVDEADATDCSRLAWLYRHLKNDERALELAELGLTKESYNHYCISLKTKLRKH